MRDLTVNELEQVNGGGVVVAFLAGYVAGKVLDAAIDAYVDYVQDFSEQDHTGASMNDSFGVS